MTLLHRVSTKKSKAGERSLFLVSDRCFPQTIGVLRSRAEPLGIELHVGPTDSMPLDGRAYGALVQYPDESGLIHDLRPFIQSAHDNGVLVAVGADLLALAILTPPGEMGADVVFGTSQRFGVPLGFGGPHAGFFATRQMFVRQMPGRIIGVSVDVHSRTAYRMALATREQHIRREKATSNICTAQALLANMAAMYAVYHGPQGLTAIALRVHLMAQLLEESLKLMGLEQRNAHYFDTVRIDVPAGIEDVQRRALASGINFRYPDERTIDIALNETVTTDDVMDILGVFASALNRPSPRADLFELPKGVLALHGAEIYRRHSAARAPS
jgi:glycine dehydrogenase